MNNYDTNNPPTPDDYKVFLQTMAQETAGGVSGGASADASMGGNMGSVSDPNKKFGWLLLAGAAGVLVLVLVLCAVPLGGRSVFERLFGGSKKVDVSVDGVPVAIEEGVPPNLGMAYMARAAYSDGLVAAERKADGAIVFLDTYGRVVFELDSEVYTLRSNQFHDGLLAVGCNNNNGYAKFGYLGTDGQLAIPCLYYSASEFADGYASVTIVTSEGAEDLISSGTVDTAGNYNETASYYGRLSDFFPL